MKKLNIIKINGERYTSIDEINSVSVKDVLNNCDNVIIYDNETNEKIAGIKKDSVGRFILYFY